MDINTGKYPPRKRGILQLLAVAVLLIAIQGIYMQRLSARDVVAMVTAASMFAISFAFIPLIVRPGNSMLKPWMIALFSLTAIACGAANLAGIWGSIWMDGSLKLAAAIALILAAITLSSSGARVEAFVRLAKDAEKQSQQLHQRTAEFAAISAKLMAEMAEMRETEQSLRQAQVDSNDDMRETNDELSFYKSALDEAAIVAVINPDGVVTHVNEKLCQISGYARGELIGMDCRHLDSQDQSGDVLAGLCETIGKGKAWRGEMRNRAKNGQFYWVDASVIPTCGSDGKVSRHVAICADITERKGAEAALEAQRISTEMANLEMARTNQKLSDLYQTAQRFVDDVSHEFRTPLSVIKGYSEILSEGVAGPLLPDQKRFAQLIVDRTRDLAQMVDDLLDTSKLRAGSLRVDRRPCTCEGIFAAVHKIIDGRAGLGKIKWVEEIEPSLPDVFVDAEKASRVIVNLVINAIKFSPEGGRITLAARMQGPDQVCITVSDEGAGIAPENLAPIFERFQQVDSDSTATKGFGLGLNIAKELVSLNLGQMSVTSTLQRGSTFGFTVPIADHAVIVSRLYSYLENRKTPAGEFAVLRVTPIQGIGVPRNLQGFIACSARPGDLVFPSVDGSSLVLCGYSAKPDSWLSRLAALGTRDKPFSTLQKLCPFDVEIVARCPYPAPLPQISALVLEHLSREAVHA